MGKFYKIKKNVARLEVGRWLLDFKLVKKGGVGTYWNFRARYIPTNAAPPHGILGQTAKEHDNSTRSSCNPIHQGGCIIEGNWRDYQIASNDIFDTDFAFNKFKKQALSYLINSHYIPRKAKKS